MDNNETNIPDETNEEQIERAFNLLVDAIPDNMCSFNVLIAINRLAAEWAQTLHEECHETIDGDEDENEPPLYGNLPGTSFNLN